MTTKQNSQVLKDFYSSLNEKDLKTIQRADALFNDYLDLKEAQKRLQKLQTKRVKLQSLQAAKKEILGL